MALKHRVHNINHIRNRAADRCCGVVLRQLLTTNASSLRAGVVQGLRLHRRRGVRAVRQRHAAVGHEHQGATDGNLHAVLAGRLTRYMPGRAVPGARVEP